MSTTKEKLDVSVGVAAQTFHLRPSLVVFGDVLMKQNRRFFIFHGPYGNNENLELLLGVTLLFILIGNALEILKPYV